MLVAHQRRWKTRWLWLGLLILGLLSWRVNAEYRKPRPEQVAHVLLGQGLTAADLERIKIGHQAGVLKVVARDGTTVKFIKGGDGLLGIDGREWAPLSPGQRDQIVSGLGLKDPGGMASSLMTNYNRISRAHALALLGVLARPGEKTPPLGAELRAKVLKFCRSRLQPEEDNIVRRQAVLALAIQPKTDGETITSMLNFLRRDHNAWNTFGVVQFFEYHREFIQTTAGYQGYLAQLAASGSPHADQIIALLKVPNSQAPPTETSPLAPAEPELPTPGAKPSPIPLP